MVECSFRVSTCPLVRTKRTLIWYGRKIGNYLPVFFFYAEIYQDMIRVNFCPGDKGIQQARASEIRICVSFAEQLQETDDVILSREI